MGSRRWMGAALAMAWVLASSPVWASDLSDGSKALKAGRPLDAIGAYHRAMGQDHDSWEPPYGLGRAFAALEVADSAEIYFEKALALKPERPEILVAMGDLRVASSKWSDAMGLYRRALAKEDDNVDATIGLGAAMTGAGKPDSAMALLKKGTLGKDRKADYLVAYGMAQVAAGQRSDGIASLTQAMTERPNDPVIAKAIGDAYLQMRVWTLAIDNYKKALDLDKSLFEAQQGLAEAYLKNKQYNDAVEQFLAIVKADSTNLRAWQVLGRVYFAGEKYPEAVVCFKKVIALSPVQTFGTLWYLARSQAYSGQVKDAATTFAEAERYLAQLGDDKDKLSDYYGLKAKTYFDAHDTSYMREGVAALRKLSEVGTVSYDQWVQAAKAYDKQLHDVSGAVDLYHHALAVKPDAHDLYFEIGKLEFTNKAYDSAVVAFRAKLLADSASANAWLLGGASFMELKQNDSALVYFKGAARTQPCNLRAMSFIVQLSQAAKRYDQVRAWANEKFKCDSTSTDRCNDLVLITQTYLVEKKTAEAQEAIDRLLGACPNHEQGLVWQMEILNQTRKSDDAVKKAREILKLYPSNKRAKEILMEIEGVDK